MTKLEGNFKKLKRRQNIPSSSTNNFPGMEISMPEITCVFLLCVFPGHFNFELQPRINLNGTRKYSSNEGRELG